LSISVGRDEENDLLLVVSGISASLEEKPIFGRAEEGAGIGVADPDAGADGDVVSALILMIFKRAIVFDYTGQLIDALSDANGLF